jgi:predicted secreted protein
VTWFSFLAIYFVLWWLVLFAMLPFGLKTQDEDGDVTLGTVPSAPRGSHMARAVLLTTLVSLAIYGIVYVSVVYLGFQFDDIPRVVPDYEGR